MNVNVNNRSQSSVQQNKRVRNFTPNNYNNNNNNNNHSNNNNRSNNKS